MTTPHEPCNGEHASPMEARACALADATARFGPRADLTLAVVEVLDLDPCYLAALSGDERHARPALAIDTVVMVPQQDGTGAARLGRATIAIDSEELANLIAGLLRASIGMGLPDESPESILDDLAATAAATAAATTPPPTADPHVGQYL